MGICVRRFAEITREDASALQERMTQYYDDAPASYYSVADQAAGQYTPAALPFHCDLVSRVVPGTSLLEVGCGSAHLCPHVATAGGSYTGIDHGDALLEQNRERFPYARFLSVRAELRETFDIVASLYTIEHVVDPPAYLESMWQFCKPGGLLAVICPDFIDGEGLPPSFFYGKTPRRLREKLTAFAISDISQHLLDLFWFAPRWKSRARLIPLPGFWINLRPRVLHGAPYSIDGDAVHLPRLNDLVDWFQGRGVEMVTTSRRLPHVDPRVLRNNCYLLVRKPVAEAKPPRRT